MKRIPRTCPYCGHVDQPGQHILAVFNGKRRGAMLGGCHCPACDRSWQEYSYRNGQVVNRAADGQQIRSQMP